MQFELLTLSGPKFQGEVAEVALMTAAGQVAILPLHEPLTSVALPGAVTFRPLRNNEGKTELYAIFGGLLEVTQDGVRLLADEAEHADDLVESEIKAALAEAKLLKTSAKDSHQAAHAHRLIDRHTVRLNVSQLKRHQSHTKRS